MAKPALDKDLKKLNRLESVTRATAQGLVPLSLVIVFLVLVGVVTLSITGLGGGWALIMGASLIGGYMALNIGANDVANNMAPAVGSRALTIGVAVCIAAVCEAAGAILAGGDVVATVSGGIVNPARLPDTAAFTTAMIAALFAAALWINLATIIGAPVSTTHSIVGGVLGGGVALAGFGAADWNVVARIVASWVISPVMGGVIAASFLAYINATILRAPDKLAEARRRVPMLVAIMAGTFSTYLILKGFSRVWDAPLWLALAIGAGVLITVHRVLKPRLARQVTGLAARESSVGDLFTIPVIAGAALLSFAHGANDVANAIGPLAAVYSSVTSGEVMARVEVPFWILGIGAAGISVGLLLYGPKLIRTVGSKITKLNRIRAFCVTLSAGITVIIASALGIPVSSTHIAIGALFGVGFLREHLANRDNGNSLPFRPAQERPPLVTPEAPPVSEKLRRRYLVRRSHLLTIIAAWLITVPASALLSAGLALTMRHFGLVSVG